MCEKNDIQCVVEFNRAGLIKGCHLCRHKKRRCSALREQLSIRRGNKVEHPAGGWQHLAIKIPVTPKSVEIIPEESGEEPTMPVVPLNPKQSEVLESQIEQGTAVYDPRTPALKIGSIKVKSRQPGEENGMLPIAKLYESSGDLASS